MSRLKRSWALVRATVAGFHRDRCFDQAALVAFYCLLSIAPALYVAGVLLARFAPGPDPVRATLLRVSPLLSADAVTALTRLIEHDLAMSTRVIAIALPGLAWAATSGLRALERAINLVFTPEGRRGVLGARLRVLAILFVFAAALGAAYLVDELILRAGLLGAGLASFASRTALLAVRFATFAMVYRLLPRGGASVRVALAGACVALPLWELARRVFGAVLSRLPTFGLVTGTLAGIVTLQLWFYAVTAIVLFGAEFASALSRLPRRAADA